jgi:hypothetical protein
METAKVDIRKLQTLNDCINRTIEALNQVRLSVHGGSLSHSAPMGVQGIGAQAWGAYPGAFGTPFGIPQQFGIGQQFGIPQVGMVPGIAGLGHTAAAYLQNLAQTTPYANQFATNPFTTNPFNTNPFTANPFGGVANVNPLGFLTQNGLGHTGVEQRLGYEWATDPYATARIAQTFPFVHWGYSPFGWPTV